MTEKSEAQLDAEAEGRKRKPIEERLAGHRIAYQVDCMVPRLVTRQPPTTFELDKREWRVEDGAGIGMPMSGNMIRRLSESPGPMFPWATAFGWLRRQCKRSLENGGHPHHRSGDRPYWRGALCWEAVRLTVIGGEKSRPLFGPLSIEDAAAVLRLDRIEDLLHNAFDDIEKEAVRIELRAERRAREQIGHGPGAIPAPEWRHHAVPGMHMADCPRCRKESAA